MTVPQRTGHRLARNSLSLGQIIASTLANIAPAMSFFFGFAVIVAGAGVGAPLTILVAMVVICFLPTHWRILEIPPQHRVFSLPHRHGLRPGRGR